MKTSDYLEVGSIYTRADLKGRFGIVDATINTGIFRPAGHDSVWLFITEVKTADRTQYEDLLQGKVLTMAGQLTGRRDHLVIEHHARGLELLVFYRLHKNQYPGGGFTYEGPFNYRTHEGSSPSLITLERAGEAL